MRHAVKARGWNVQVRIDSGSDLRRVHRNLSQMAGGKEIRKRFTKAVRAELRPVTAEVKAAYRSAPSKGGKRRPPGRAPLRRAMARATTAQVRTAGRDAGISLRVDGRKMPEGMGGVPAMYERRRRWRHPVFGQDVWVTQDSRPTFDRIVPARASGVRRRVERLADGLGRDMTKG